MAGLQSPIADSLLRKAKPVIDIVKSQWFLIDKRDPDWAGDPWVYSNHPGGSDCLYDSIQVPNKKLNIGQQQPKIMVVGILSECGFNISEIAALISCGNSTVDATRNIRKMINQYKAIQNDIAQIINLHGDVPSDKQWGEGQNPYRAHRRWYMTHTRILSLLAKDYESNKNPIEKP